LQVIRAFCTQKHEEKRFDDKNIDFTKLNLFINRTMSCLMPFTMFVMNITNLLVLWAGSDGVNNGTLQVGNVMTVMQYSIQIIMSFFMLSMAISMYPRAAISTKRIMEVLDTTISVKDPKIPIEFDESKKGEVTFENVCFKYPGAEENVLNNINFTAYPGQTTAIIGSTGSGKSTLINLIPRFYDVTEGKVMVGGVSVKHVKMKDLRDRIGYVPQKSMLFFGTIKSNISYGGDIKQEQVVKAAKIAQAEQFIMDKRDGYDFGISQGGSNVSGGQRQRLSIARAIAKDPLVYIFDDSFSALDYKTDNDLRKELKKATTNAAVIIVAQRVSTILNADKILVLRNGNIVGQGTHRELLKNCEVYREIAESQLSKEELENV
ncbi:MAG: ABC transporter ATP-binding protein/permease, partial [Oscillospiraceae bacterium]|nr:ABC transporter ATP-binding protein/permease [Oscillospiraceae bacterium]